MTQKKKLVKVSQKRGRICIKAFHKFFSIFKSYQNFTNRHSGRLSKTYSTNICFALTSSSIFWNLSFYFCITVHKTDDSFKFFWKKIVCYIFLLPCHILSFQSSGLNCEFIRRECSFSRNSKISLVSSGNKLILIMKISAPIFEDFNILQILILKLYFQFIIVSTELPSVELSIVQFKPILKHQNFLSLFLAFDYFFLIGIHSMQV